MYKTELATGPARARAELGWLLRYLRGRSIGPLLFVSALAFGLIFGQRYAVDERWLGFLRWNLILAWVPYGAALALELVLRRGVWRWAALPLAAGWLLFLPNAPYILTDMVHIWGSNLDALWYTVGMIAACGLAGVFLP